MEATTVSFGYQIETDDIARVGEIIGGWVGTSPLEPFSELGSWEISFDSDGVELYGVVAHERGKPLLVVTGEMNGGIDVSLPKLEALGHQLAEAGFAYRADYIGRDANGEPVTEERYLR